MATLGNGEIMKINAQPERVVRQNYYVVGGVPVVVGAKQYRPLICYFRRLHLVDNLALCLFMGGGGGWEC